jgi:hypothetical protein
MHGFADLLVFRAFSYVLAAVVAVVFRVWKPIENRVVMPIENRVAWSIENRVAMPIESRVFVLR